MRRLGSLLLVALWACHADVQFGDDVLLQCKSASDCPDPLVCVSELALCRPLGSACIEARDGGHHTSRNGTSCDGDGICVRGACVASSCGDGYRDEANEECDDGELNSDEDPNACRKDCTKPRCGDGVIDARELCDDGADNDDALADACRSNCETARCGDHVIDSGEACDDGPDNDEHAACRTSCVLATCGDGVIGPGEACDTAGDSALCDADCTPAACGDDTVNSNAGEECDDGGESQDCNANCTFWECGDGILNTLREECDDRGETARCDTDCTIASCGDGAINETAGETCDDGNGSLADACPSGLGGSCKDARCGDGFIGPGETCDDGNDALTDACPSGPDGTCAPAFCGDGFVGPGETCDDGNADLHDLCPSGALGACHAAECGDGYIGPGEACDDGDRSSGDGCSAACAFESGWDCADEPSLCVAHCGDGVRMGSEDCDDAGESRACDTDCSAASCGDGDLNTTRGETCDDPLSASCGPICLVSCSSGSADADGSSANGCEASVGSTSWVSASSSATFITSRDVIALRDGTSLAVGEFLGSAAFGNGVSLTAVGSGTNGFVVHYGATGLADWAQRFSANASGNVAVRRGQGLADGSVTLGIQLYCPSPCSATLAGTAAPGPYSGTALLLAHMTAAGVVTGPRLIGMSDLVMDLNGLGTRANGGGALVGDYCVNATAPPLLCDAYFGDRCVGGGNSGAPCTSHAACSGGKCGARIASNNKREAFFVHFDSAFAVDWVQRGGRLDPVGSTENVDHSARDVSVFPDGSAAVTGYFCNDTGGSCGTCSVRLGNRCSGGADAGSPCTSDNDCFNSCGVTLTSNSCARAYFLTFAPSGAVSWVNVASQTSSASSLLRGNGIVALPDGTSVAVGRFTGTTTFGPGASALVASAPTFESSAFVLKFAANGAPLWLTTGNELLANDVALLPSGGVAVAGQALNTAHIGSTCVGGANAGQSCATTCGAGTCNGYLTCMAGGAEGASCANAAACPGGTCGLTLGADTFGDAVAFALDASGHPTGAAANTDVSPNNQSGEAVATFSDAAVLMCGAYAGTPTWFGTTLPSTSQSPFVVKAHP